MSNIEISNQWKLTLKLFKPFSDNPSKEDVIESAKEIATKLKNTLKSLDKLKFIDEDEGLYLQDELEMIIDNFEHLVHLMDGTISEEDFDNYSYDGDYISRFNEYMDMLYDIANSRILLKPNVSYKFLWVEVKRN